MTRNTSSTLIKIASKILKDVTKSQKTDKIVIFLGGSCPDDNAWRTGIKKEFKNKAFFIDPYDENWDPEDNIYDELAGMLSADYVIFFEGGKGTKKEKKFMDIMDAEYEEFDEIEKLKEYINRVLENI